MDINFNNATYNFVPWKPTTGKVFPAPYSFDCETTAIDDEQHWLTPAYVLGAAFDGNRGFFVPRDALAAFFESHVDVPVVMHNASFDLAVIDAMAPTLNIYDRVDQDLVTDTRLLHRGYMLATEGHTAEGKGASTLERCAELYLGIELPKDLVDSEGHEVRLSYGRWLNAPPTDIEPIYLEYLAKDVIVTYRVWGVLNGRLLEALAYADDAFGYVSDDQLGPQIDRWGLQTHHIQLKASIVLEKIAANGMHIDRDRLAELLPVLTEIREISRVVLRQQGYEPGLAGCNKALQEIFQRLEAKHSERRFPRTDTGQYKTSREAVAELAGTEPFLDALLKFKEADKLRGSFLDKMGRPVVHASFDVLKTTGRTSSFGEINLQNLPRDDRIRSCFVPSPGHVFISADYKTLEMATLAQVMITQFGAESQMAALVNAGRDLHRAMAATMAGKPESEVTAAERQKAKAINFGKPGGLGDDGLRRYAKISYGVDLEPSEVTSLTEAWFTTFPEMCEFLSRDADNLALDMSYFFELTPTTYFEHTGIDSFLMHPNNAGRENHPHGILGAMCLRAIRDPNPTRQTGQPYAAEEIDYFWSRLAAHVDEIPRKYRRLVQRREPSPRFQQAIMRLVDQGKVLTATGRLRTGASYCPRHNTLFQGLAADGAKLALWKLWRAGYRLVNFLHDEVIIEVPEGDDLRQHAETIRRLMIEGMREVVPNVQIDVDYAAAARWYKSAKKRHDTEGRLLLWKPTAVNEDVPAALVTSL